MANYSIDNRPAAVDWETRDWIARTLQNCKNLLRLHMAELPYDRLRGLDPAIYDRPVGQVAAGLRGEIERIMAWEPDAEVLDARAYPSGGEPGAPLIIEVDLAIGDD